MIRANPGLRTLWYMGVKTRIIPGFIAGAIGDSLTEGGALLDLCCGTAVVARSVAHRYPGLATDVQRFSAVIARAHLEGARLLPLGELESRLGELAEWRERPIVVHCHHGPRSERAVRTLLDAGFRQVESLDGGIEAWSLTVDPEVPRY